MSKFYRIIFAAAIALASTFIASAQNQAQQFSPDQKLRYAEALIENYYVEPVNADSLVTEAIVAMLKTLDPHSQYSTPEETKELTQPLDGKFSGIGIQFSLVRDTVYVVQTTAGGPSERAGILPGDRIIYVNDSIFTRPKMVNSDVTKTLRGAKGSKVNLKIMRGDDPKLIEFKLVRQDIPIYSVDASYMIEPEVGYISIGRFAESTPTEVAEAITKLKKKGMKHLVLDLAGNGGGYLGAAHGLASMFLNKGDLVVYTEGSAFPTQYLTVDENINAGIDRVVVIVDQYSASASEIVSGALQDQDRAVIVGRRTFGKGLVQRPFPFPDGSMIRLTTSRYHTPSGRFIQKPYEKGRGEEYQLDLLNRYNHGELWSADSIKVDENLKYKTLRNGRTVYGGGGIIPDVFVPVDTSYYSTYYRDLVAKGTINTTVTDYVQRERKALLKAYPNEDVFFEKYSVPQSLIDDLQKRAEADSIPAKPEDIQRSMPMITAVLKGLITRDIYANGNYARAVNPLNPLYNKAREIITNPTRYNELLKP
jgi:carboxyl-terminal processing protease